MSIKIKTKYSPNFDLKKRKNKDIDFLIYYRAHSNKSSMFDYKFIKNLVKHNFKIFVVNLSPS